MTTCAAPDCAQPTKNKKCPWCAMHEMRVRRHGDPHKSITETPLPAVERRPQRFVVVPPNHPLARSRSKTTAHRLALYSAIGGGTHACFRCGRLVDWEVEGPGKLVVARLDISGPDDAVNLRPSCARCVIARGQRRRADALRERGWFAATEGGTT
jgi:hypothetical protein